MSETLSTKTENGGWIKLHRKILDWEWYKHPYIFSVFLHLILSANHENKQWQGVEIKRGQLITSLDSLYFQLNYNRKTGKLTKCGKKISIRNIRTALSKLKLTKEIAIETTSKYTLITINNYDRYQAIDKPNDKQVTNKRQTSDKQVTTNKKEKNEKNEKKNTLGDQVSPRTEVKKEFGNKQISELVEYLKTKSRLPALDDTKENNRRYGYLLLNKYKGKEEDTYDNSLSRLKILVDFLSNEPFWRTKVTSLQKFHKFSVTIYAQAEEQNAKKRIS